MLHEERGNMAVAAVTPHGWKAELVAITPAMASKAIDEALPNRTRKERAVQRYKDDMLNGRWDELNGETVKFIDGRLADGLQRLSALEEAGKENPEIVITFLVVNGVSSNAMMTVDSGVPRSFSDWLRIEKGLPASTLYGAVTSRMYRWDQGIHAAKTWNAASYVILSDYYDKHEDEIVHATTQVDGQAVRSLMAVSVFSTVSIILRRIDPAEADKFLDGLLTGAELEANSPILNLRNRLMADRANQRGRSRNAKSNAAVYPPQEIARAITFLGWNAWRQGRIVDRLMLPKGDLARNYPLPR